MKKWYKILILFPIITGTAVTGIYLLYGFLTGEDKIFEPSGWVYQLQNPDINEISILNVDLVVIDYSYDGSAETEFGPDNISLLRTSGIIPIAYISIGEAEDYRFYFNNTWRNEPPEWLGPENPEWKGNYPVKFWYDEWRTIIFSYLDRIIDAGFAGIYLDKVDVFEYSEAYAYDTGPSGDWAADYPNVSTAAVLMIDFIKDIANYVRNRTHDFIVIPQNGENILDYDKDGILFDIVNGWGVEDLFYNGIDKVPDEVVKQRLYYLDLLKDHGMFLLSIDYIDDGNDSVENKNRISDYFAKAVSHGLIPYAYFRDRMLDRIDYNGIYRPAYRNKYFAVPFPLRWKLFMILEIVNPQHTDIHIRKKCGKISVPKILYSFSP